MVGINNTHLAFCFDEACEYILSMKTHKEVKKDGNLYKQECWVKEPNWNDKKTYKKNNNNNELIIEMQKNLQNFK